MIQAIVFAPAAIPLAVATTSPTTLPPLAASGVNARGYRRFAVKSTANYART